MNQIGVYGVSKQYYGSGVEAAPGEKKQNVGAKDIRKNSAAAIYQKSTDAGKVNELKESRLTDKAKELLEELKSKYGDTDFVVADYETDEEASRYLSRGNKEFSVLLDPDTLNAMAEDEDVKAKYLGILDDSRSKLQDMINNLGDEKENVKKVGISVKDDGTVSFFAELEKVSEKQKERIEKIKENKENKKEEKLTKRINAASVEELLEQIRNIDWNKILEESKEKTGGSIDYSV